MAMAISDSVTVSIGLLTNGVFSVMVLVSAEVRSFSVCVCVCRHVRVFYISNAILFSNSTINAYATYITI